MNKTLYSLMLSEDVVREIDAMAHRLGTNRSNLINEILAEYVNFTTPERRINDILSEIEQLMLPSPELIPFFAPHSGSLSLKSSLEYKYRPTVKYELSFFSGSDRQLGELSVIFRTQSASLIQRLTEFFSLWKSIEDRILPSFTGAKAEYSLYDGRFVRSLAVPDKTVSSELLAAAFSEYIKLFDSLMKAYLSGKIEPQEMEAEYLSHQQAAAVHF